MKPITEICELPEHDYFVPSCEYDDLLASFEHEIIASEDFGSYSGDTAAVFRDGERYGWLTFGWGSCSYCDALQACESVGEVEALRNELYGQIHWERSADAFVRWIRERDWEGQWEWHEPGFRDFVRRVVADLRPA